MRNRKCVRNKILESRYACWFTICLLCRFFCCELLSFNLLFGCRWNWMKRVILLSAQKELAFLLDFGYIRYLFIYFDCCCSIWFFWLWRLARLTIESRYILSTSIGTYISLNFASSTDYEICGMLFSVSFLSQIRYTTIWVCACWCGWVYPIYRSIVQYKYKAIIIIQFLNPSYLYCKPFHFGVRVREHIILYL